MVPAQHQIPEGKGLQPLIQGHGDRNQPLLSGHRIPAERSPACTVKGGNLCQL